jgi:hypothetical protein
MARGPKVGSLWREERRDSSRTEEIGQPDLLAVQHEKARTVCKQSGVCIRREISYSVSRTNPYE